MPTYEYRCRKPAPEVPQVQLGPRGTASLVVLRPDRQEVL